MNGDIYDGGTPKYSTAQDIYDALAELVQTEEMGILAEIGIDVSWENQGYYYFDKGNALKERFEQMTDYGNKMWIIDLAITQMDFTAEHGGRTDVHDFIYEALMEGDVAKRVGFKKIFVEDMLGGDPKQYGELAEQYADELQGLNRFSFQDNWSAWARVVPEQSAQMALEQYRTLTNHLVDRVRRLDLAEEKNLVAECRAHLTSYDDFIYGLRVNQTLHEAQEQAYGARLAALQAAYAEKERLLLLAAERAGLLALLNSETERLGLTNGAVLAIDEPKEGGEAW
jgi:hypothetical protein